jgi:hypothetical protein
MYVLTIDADDEAVFLPAGETRAYRALVDAVVLTEARYWELRAAEEVAEHLTPSTEPL